MAAAPPDGIPGSVSRTARHAVGTKQTAALCVSPRRGLEEGGMYGGSWRDRSRRDGRAVRLRRARRERTVACVHLC